MLSAKLLLAAIAHVHRNEVSYLSVNCSVRCSSVTITRRICRTLQSLWKVAFVSATESLTMVFVYKRYGQPTLATAGLLVTIKVTAETGGVLRIK